MLPALGVIPVRYGSTRFPGKPLAPILGKPMIFRVIDGARKAVRLARVVVATDDSRILDAVLAYGAEAVMTRPGHLSGTDRVAEVAASSDLPIVVNIQGDEPLVDGDMLDRLVEALEDSDAPMASLMAPVLDVVEIGDPNRVKVVADVHGEALYFSRSPLPHGAVDRFHQHIGIYAYRRDFLLEMKTLAPSRLEKAERLEQLRILEAGYRIRMVEIDRPPLSVDVPADIMRVERLLRGESPHE